MTGDGAVVPAADAVVEVAAPAKINLGLLVGPVRSDGFHEIFSAMLPVTLADLVTARPAPVGAGLALTCGGPRRGQPRRQGRARARAPARAHVRRAPGHRQARAGGGRPGRRQLRCRRRLTAVDRLFALDLPARLCYEIAGAVGSDVPFFLWPGPQLAMGRGTVLKEIELPEPLHVVVALPALALSTADVYRWFGERPGAPATALAERRAFVERTQTLLARLGAARRPRDLATVVENDLEPPVVARHPMIGELRGASARPEPSRPP